MRKFVLTISLALPLFLIGCTKKSAPTSKIQVLAHDFGIQQVSDESIPQSFTIDPDCNVQLAKALCVSDQTETEIDLLCSNEKVTPAQIAALVRVKDSLPPFHQKVMCHLGRVQIQKNIFSIAFATSVKGTDRRPLGMMISIRPEVLESKTTEDLFSWKEQLNFGISNPNDPQRRYDPTGPLAKEGISSEYPPYLPTVIHELNHLIDYLNRANTIDFENCEETADPHVSFCKVPESSYTRFFWDNKHQVLNYVQGEDPSVLDTIPEAVPEWKTQWPLVGKLCFYYCTTTQPSTAITATYEELKKTNFATSYSTQNEYEDFAETGTYYALESIGVPFKYMIYNSSGVVYFDGHEHYLSDAMKEKRDWFSNFFQKDLSYSLPASP